MYAFFTIPLLTFDQDKRTWLFPFQLFVYDQMALQQPPTIPGNGHICQVIPGHFKGGLFREGLDPKGLNLPLVVVRGCCFGRLNGPSGQIMNTPHRSGCLVLEWLLLGMAYAGVRHLGVPPIPFQPVSVCTGGGHLIMAFSYLMIGALTLKSLYFATLAGL